MPGQLQNIPVATGDGLNIWSSDAPFCPHCGSLLVFPDFGDVTCDHCPFRLPMNDMPKPVVVTQSYPKPTPEWLSEHKLQIAAQRGEVDVSKGKKIVRATVDEECPKCRNPTMEYYTMQMRSADEGQTVFYECPNTNCGHKFSVNT